MIDIKNIDGFTNEYEFVKYLNGRMVSELNPLFRELIDNLFYGFKEYSVIKCWRNHQKQKTDIFIKIDNIIKGISIKKGIKNSVHVDKISEFIHFLIENNINKDIIKKYLKYHYADGTTNGSGLTRLPIEEYKKKHQKSIDEINKAFNTKELLNNAIERFILKGNNSKYSIDALVYGEVNDFFWITKDEIREIILSKKDIYSSAVHFGSITCQPKSRCLNYNPKYEKDRFCVQLKWYNLHDEIIEYKNNQVIKSRIMIEEIDKMLSE